jgi:hypothetical protein
MDNSFKLKNMNSIFTFYIEIRIFYGLDTLNFPTGDFEMLSLCRLEDLSLIINHYSFPKFEFLHC